ncbi:T9SS type A sorting domain-containing protein [Agriterribacter sp.]|uniref:PKD domain-containing protein n=1 Tax=Agriterribacter sp. TaxID=2821509 RepID=UPI002CAEC8EE|nr:T9SS type A sorting domain-containing protein [Agriterribacter sp.]HRP56084.1 T9SS type A sorting domain-containing protein [Agriterribacter sp.]
MNQNQKCGIVPNVPLRTLFSFFIFLSSFFIFSIQSSFAQYQKTQRAVSTQVSPTILGFYESLPVDYASNPTKKYPLLIFLHGVGELGNGTTQLPLVLKNAVPKLLNQGTFPASFTVGGEKFSFIVISPQFTRSSGQPEAIEAMINYCIQHYRVDVSRIYLTGLSLGGKRTWDFPASSKDRVSKLAAIVPVCSGASGTASGITTVTGANLPMWFLNNSGDPYISATKAQELVNKINATSISPKAKITIHQAGGHDAWTKSYDPNFRVNQMNIYEWMLSYRKGSAPQPAPAPAPAAPDPLPVAHAGQDIVITLPASSAALDGSKSIAPSGSTYRWEQTIGPGTATIGSPSGIKTSVSGLNKAGDYAFRLRVTDTKGNVSYSVAHVIVNAAAVSTLKAVAGSNQTITLPKSSVTLDGTGSSGPSGLTHLWKQTAGPKTASIGSIYSIKTTVSGLTSEGTYSFQLQLKDTKGNIAVSTVNITVQDAAPSTTTLKSVAGPDQTVALPASSVQLDGTASYGPVGLTHLWKQTGGPKTATIGSIYSIKTTVSGLTTAGDYSFQLELKDTKGNRSTSTVHVIVKAASTVPLYADAGPNQTITLPVTKVKLNGSENSTAPSGSTHTWSQAVGPVQAKIAAPWSIGTDVTGLTVAGTYKFRLLITDPKGNSVSSYITITVKSAVSARTMASPDVNITQDQSLQAAVPEVLSAPATLEMTINPNPVKSDMNIRIGGRATGKTNMIVYSLTGQVLLQQEFMKNTSGSLSKTFNVSKLAAGTYIAQVIVDNKYRKTMKILKQ